MKLLFYSFCPPEDPSTVHRCYLMARELEKHDIQADVWAGSFSRSLSAGLLWVTANMHKYDAIVFHRHGSLPAYLLTLAAKRLGKRVILDFDDALFAFDQPDVESNHKALNHYLGYSMLNSMINHADATTVGSHYLMDYARQYSDKVYLVPTAIDTNTFKPMLKQSSREFVIGWIGNGPNHINNLQLLIEPLQQLAEHNHIKFKIVSALGNHRLMAMFPNHVYDVDYGLDRMVNIKQVPNLVSDFDISVCPLQDNSFFRGTCACKMLTSMAMGIPVVASSVGEHAYIIENTVNGLFADADYEWTTVIQWLINDRDFCEKLGKAGLETVRDRYTLEKCAKQFAEICLG